MGKYQFHGESGAVVPFANNTGINTQPAQNITFSAFNKFNFLLERCGIGSFP